MTEEEMIEFLAPKVPVEKVTEEKKPVAPGIEMPPELEELYEKVEELLAPEPVQKPEELGMPSLYSLLVAEGTLYDVTGEGPQAILKVEEEEEVLKEKTPEDILIDTAFEYYSRWTKSIKNALKRLNLPPEHPQHLSLDAFNKLLESIENEITQEVSDEVRLEVFKILEEDKKYGLAKPYDEAIYEYLKEILYTRGLIEEKPKDIDQLMMENYYEIKLKDLKEELKNALRDKYKEFKRETYLKKYKKLNDDELKELYRYLREMYEHKTLPYPDLFKKVERELINRGIDPNTIPEPEDIKKLEQEYEETLKEMKELIPPPRKEELPPVEKVPEKKEVELTRVADILDRLFTTLPETKIKEFAKSKESELLLKFLEKPEEVKDVGKVAKIVNTLFEDVPDEELIKLKETNELSTLRTFLEKYI